MCFPRNGAGNPTDIVLQENEKESAREESKSEYKIITSWTISAKDGSYTRSYQETKNTLENGIKVIGIKYKTKLHTTDTRMIIWLLKNLFNNLLIDFGL